MPKKTTRLHLGDVRDTILERDQTYVDNASALLRRIRSGKVPDNYFRKIQPSLAMAALRRAGYSMQVSMEMMKA